MGILFPGALLLGALGLVPVVQMTARPAAAAFGATLLLDGGSAHVLRQGGFTVVDAAGGEGLQAGDMVQAGETGRVRLLYSGGTMTTLERGARVMISELRTDAHSALHVRLRQDSGRTWNRIVNMVRGSAYAVDGPNNAVAEVRGTEFAVSVETDPVDRQPVVSIDLASGLLDVSAAGTTLRLEAGASTTVRAAGPPAPPLPSHLAPPPPPPAPTAGPISSNPISTPTANRAQAPPGPATRRQVVPASSSAPPSPGPPAASEADESAPSAHDPSPSPTPAPSPARSTSQAFAGDSEGHAGPSPSTPSPVAGVHPRSRPESKPEPRRRHSDLTRRPDEHYGGDQ